MTRAQAHRRDTVTVAADLNPLETTRPIPRADAGLDIFDALDRAYAEDHLRDGGQQVTPDAVDAETARMRALDQQMLAARTPRARISRLIGDLQSLARDHGDRGGHLMAAVDHLRHLQVEHVPARVPAYIPASSSERMI